MTPKLAAGTLALAMVAAALPALADTVKPGEWEYTVTTRMPNMPQLPPGVKLPPNLHIERGEGGMTVRQTSCVKASDPTAGLGRPHGPGASESHCTVEHLQRNGGKVSWRTTCTMPAGTLHSEGTAHYSGDAMEADFHTQTTRSDAPPMETSAHVVGRYLGPCRQ